jgi:hypothetical protein
MRFLIFNPWIRCSDRSLVPCPEPIEWNQNLKSFNAEYAEVPIKALPQSFAEEFSGYCGD